MNPEDLERIGDVLCVAVTEVLGIYFGKDPTTLLVNVQHSAAPDGDGTWAITAD